MFTPRYVLDLGSGLARAAHLSEKLRFLSNRGIGQHGYIHHGPFLFPTELDRRVGAHENAIFAIIIAFRRERIFELAVVGPQQTDFDYAFGKDRLWALHKCETPCWISFTSKQCVRIDRAQYTDPAKSGNPSTLTDVNTPLFLVVSKSPESMTQPASTSAPCSGYEISATVLVNVSTLFVNV